MLKKYKDYISSVVIIVIGTILFCTTFSIKKIGGVSTDIGSDLMPKITSLLLIMIGILLFIQKYIFGKKNKKVDFNITKTTVPTKLFNKAVLSTLIIILLYIILMQPLGFILSTTIYLITQIFVLTPKEYFKSIRVIIIAVVTSVVVYYLFVYFFYLLLPAGILG